MIKFFRKIRQRLLTENKYSKYLIYAIGEIILVVIGILIALQINNWNENRIAKIEEGKYLNALLTEAKTNKVKLLRLIENRKTILNAVNYTIDHLNKPVLNPHVIDSIYIKLGWTFGLSFTLLNTSAYSEMESSGRLQNITNDSLRNAIVDFYEYLDYVNDIEDRGPVHFWNHDYSPFFPKHLNYTKTIKSWNSDKGLHELDLPPMPFWTLSKTHPLKIEFYNLLSRYYTGSWWILNSQKRLLKQVETIHSMLRDNLEIVNNDKIL
ncbi:DUF6090 family protein [Seonamhaeicola maritimus]|uniref:Uncharacterized protein n=1 Tax=Seonamhaeicola maritimus TaxID=2591822 RepID=A0A5C7GGE3_9FLAO|nr:DUF6090 family protein [Seonamhaeicola maritimus]TXG35777.1 hypothetical protein FUA22_14880 [Seonamhaeicola maritimus]